MSVVQPPQPVQVHVLIGARPYFQLQNNATVLLYIMVAHDLYGPYQTDLTTTPQIWAEKRLTNTSPEGKALMMQLRELEAQLVHAWSALLPPTDEPAQPESIITGDLILKQAGLAYPLLKVIGMVPQAQPKAIQRKKVSLHFLFTDGTTPEYDFKKDRFNRLDPLSKGYIEFTIKVENKRYGPYRTSIKTTFRIWERKNTLRPTRAQKRIKEKVRQYRLSLFNGLNELPLNQKPLTGAVIIGNSSLKPIERKGGLVYALA